MSLKLEIKIPVKATSTPIWIGHGYFHSPELVNCLKSTKASRFFIISDMVVSPLHVMQLREFLSSKGFNVSLLTIEPGEQHKTRKTKEWLEDQVLSTGAGRDTCFIAVGGGVITDITGFLASTYCRGVPVVMLPTSLLAMVDASIGGKTAVDTPQGKNLIGALYQPTAVFMDTSTLVTLPIDELKNGMVEMIKHGLITDADYFQYMKNNSQKLLEKEERLLDEAIYKSCQIKAKIIAEDETEQGKRRLLNFGHTIGHAIETATHHKIPHGRAVAIGIEEESYLAMQMGHLKQADFDVILQTFHQFQMDLSLKEDIKPIELLQLMRMDKKASQSTPRFVILQEIGKSLEFDGQYVTSVDEKVLKNGLEWMCSYVMRRS